MIEDLFGGDGCPDAIPVRVIKEIEIVILAEQKCRASCA
jgi:hypothetical protein